MLVYLTLFACAALMVLLVRRYNLHGREPWYMLLAAVALGVGLMWVAGAAEDRVLGRLRLGRDALAAKAAVVTLIEEAAKLLIVPAIALAFRRHFRGALDGIIYGTLGGLGMAVEESLMYLSLTPDKNAAALGAEVVRLFAHALMGGLLGFAVGLTLDRRARRGRRPALLPLTCVAVALIVHFSWDYVAYQGHVAAALRGVLMLLMLALMLVWGGAVAYATRLTRRFESRAIPPAGLVVVRS